MKIVQKLNTSVSNSSRNLSNSVVCQLQKGKDTKDCIEDLYRLYKLSENSGLVHDKEYEINKFLFSRVPTVDWLIRKHQELHLKPETLHLCICIFDKYLRMVEMTMREEIKLVGISAMLIVSKYEEIRRQVKIECLGVDYSSEDIVAMEKRILKSLDWKLTFPTPYMFIVCLLQMAPPSRKKVMEYMVFFFAELGMITCSTKKYCPSMIAASAFYAARCILNEYPLWTKKLEDSSTYSELQLMDPALLLLTYHGSATMFELEEFRKKYSSPELGAVALCCPADEETFRMLELRRRVLLGGMRLSICL